MTREDILRKLKENGVEAVAKESVKNSVIFRGIIIPTGRDVSPIIYTDEIIEKAERTGMLLEEVVEEILDIYERNKDVSFGVDKILERDWMMEHVVVGFQKDSIENIVKKDSGFMGIEMYLYLCGDRKAKETFTVKVTEALLQYAGVTEAEAWDAALQHTCEDTEIESMWEVMERITGASLWEQEDQLHMYIISNKSHMHGASAILNRKKLESLARVYGVDQLIVLPSSIHEMLVMPYNEEMDMRYMNQLVKEVNAEEVIPEERLTDQAYLISFFKEKCVVGCME